MRKSPSSQSGHLVPAQVARHARVGHRADRVPRRDGVVLGVLVVVDEDGVRRALLLPPRRGRHALGAALDLARQRQRRRAHGREVPPLVDADHDVHPARARRAREADEPVLAQHLAGQQRDAAHAVPRRVGHRVDVDAQLVGVVEVRAPHRVRVPVDVAERDRPQQVRGVDRHELLRLAAGRELQHRRLEPLRALRGHALLVDRLRLDPAREALEHRRALAHLVEDRVRAFHVVAGEIALRPARLREVDLAGIGELDLVPVDLEDLVLRRHEAKRDTMPPWLSLSARSSSRPTPSRARSAPPRSRARSAAGSSAPG